MFLTRLFNFRLAHVAHLQRESQVLGHGHVGKQRVVLEHHANAALVRRRVVDGLALHIDFAMGCGLKTRQHHQGGGFA